MERASQRRLRRFYSADTLSKPDQEIFLGKEETRHLKNILRLSVGGRCLVTDGRGREAEARIENFATDGRAVLRIEKVTDSPESQSRLVLKTYVALVQRTQVDYFVEKGQELGVREFIPLETQRTALKIPEPSLEKILSRWNKIAQEAAKQSGSLDLIKISPPQSFEESVRKIPSHERAVIFHPAPGAVLFAEWLKSVRPEETPVVHLFWGPEGGFSEKEVATAKNLPHLDLVHLGQRILKTDTAYLGVVSCLRFLFL